MEAQGNAKAYDAFSTDGLRYRHSGWLLDPWGPQAGGGDHEVGAVGEGEEVHQSPPMACAGEPLLAGKDAPMATPLGRSEATLVRHCFAVRAVSFHRRLSCVPGFTARCRSAACRVLRLRAPSGKRQAASENHAAATPSWEALYFAATGAGRLPGLRPRVPGTRPNAQHHQPDWAASEGGEGNSRPGRGR